MLKTQQAPRPLCLCLCFNLPNKGVSTTFLNVTTFSILVTFGTFHTDLVSLTKALCSRRSALLNQARAGHRPACAWFLKVDPVRTSVCVCVCVCVSAPEAINN